jgi:hypothetical protein
LYVKSLDISIFEELNKDILRYCHKRKQKKPLGNSLRRQGISTSIILTSHPMQQKVASVHQACRLLPAIGFHHHGK